MRGIKPYVNVEGKVFEIYECTAEKSYDAKTFMCDSVMGALLLNKRDLRIDELNKILSRVTLYSEKKISRRIRHPSGQENHRKDGGKSNVQPAADRDDRLIYTYRPFVDLIRPDEAARKSRVKNRGK